MEFPSHPSGSKEHAAHLEEALASSNQQLAVGENSAAASQPVARYSTPEHEAALVTVRAATHAVAVKRNVPLTTEQIDFAAGLAADSLGAVALRSLAAEEREFIPQLASAIRHALDVLSAMRLITALTEKAGYAAPDILDASARANRWLAYAPANDHDQQLRVWPELEDAMWQYAQMRGSGPVKMTLPGRATTRYFLDPAACRGETRDKAVGLCLWRLNPFDDALPAKAYGTETFGPVIHRMADGAVVTTYWRRGRLHRDPIEGPAQHIQRGDHVLAEYYVDGELHRDGKDGPAVTYTYLEGNQIAGEEYFEDGVWQRPSADGPAVFQRDHGGRIVRELYIEDGCLHRDPASGPARYAIEDGIEQIEYRIGGRLHREDGPAVIERDGTGRVTLEEFWRDGTLIASHDPARPNRRARKAARKCAIWKALHGVTNKSGDAQGAHHAR